MSDVNQTQEIVEPIKYAVNAVQTSTDLSTFEAIGISIVASLITVGLIGLIKFLYSKGLMREIQKRIKQTQTNIEGVWEAEGEEKLANNSIVKYRDHTTLIQVGRDIEGTSIYTMVENGQDETKQFKLKGFIKNDVVSGTYENIDNSKAGVGSFTFVIKDDGNKLDGIYLVYDVYSRVVQNWQYFLTKKSNIAS